MGKLDQALQRGRPGVERRRPRIDMRNIGEAARQSIQQPFLLSRRTEKDTRLVHLLPSAADECRHRRLLARYEPPGGPSPLRSDGPRHTGIG
jgi:hypothetical protein